MADEDSAKKYGAFGSFNPFLTTLATVAMAWFAGKLYCVSNQQLEVQAINLAPRVIVTARWPKGESNVSFTVSNEGHSSAYNVKIAAHTIWRTPSANFDPFKSAGATKPQLQTVDELLPKGTAGTYVVNGPNKGENLYFYGSYSYESRLPEIPKTVQKFCYLARDNGTVESYGTFHVLFMRGTIGLGPLKMSAKVTVPPKTSLQGKLPSKSHP